ncbi:serine hydrolase domain-containing protein [Aquipuribacter nitratireducens]|uniref:Serine hydrolase domain-containing protein n=1 Tax=Aquipuribacter nitratireducens TaxID=650104 RepID=A0ABW0GML6_9MICO
MSTEALRALDRRLAERAEADELSGAVLLSVAGETLLEGCYGLADRAAGVPVTTRTRFGVASMSKMFTAAAVLDLVGEGRLTVGDRVVDVLPAARRPATLRDDVTVHHLLTHTSGIADYAEEDEDTPGYVEDYGALWRDLPCYRVERPDDFLPLYGDRPPYRAPGERFHYSNAGYVLLSAVVEEVTGRPFTAVVTERVLGRAGMTASGYFRTDEARPDVAVGHLPRDDGPWRSNVFSIPVVGGGDGGAFVTARDVDRFLTAFEDGSLLGGLRDAALTRHTEVLDAPGFGMGYGVILYPDGRFGHGGGDPGVDVLAQRWPEEGATLVVLCNMAEPAADIRTAVLEAWRAPG